MVGFLKHNAISLFVLVLVLATSQTEIAHAVDSIIEGNIVFNGPGQNGARDIHTTGNIGGLRFYNATSLTAIPGGAAIQFFGNGHTAFPGQAFIDSGAHDNAAVIFRTAPTSGGITERMRVTAQGNVGIGTNNPQDQLELTGNLRLPPTTATTGIIRSGANTLIHTKGSANFFAGIGAGNLSITGGASGNTGVGNNALTALDFAFGNTALGVNALTANTDGNNNTAAGGNALEDNTEGGANTAVGISALRNNTQGSDNVGVGTVAGQTNLSGSNNTFIGSSADASTDALENATAIGANAIVGASNSLVLGGTGENAVSVGIGTTTPVSTLQVATGYIQVRVITSAPVAADCDTVAESGRMVVRTDSAPNFYVCNGTAWVAVGT